MAEGQQGLHRVCATGLHDQQGRNDPRRGSGDAVPGVEGQEAPAHGDAGGVQGSVWEARDYGLTEAGWALVRGMRG